MWVTGSELCLYRAEINRFKILSTTRYAGLHICHKGHCIQREFICNQSTQYPQKQFLLLQNSHQDNKNHGSQTMMMSGKNHRETQRGFWTLRLSVTVEHYFLIIYEPRLYGFCYACLLTSSVWRKHYLKVKCK